jgi:hypothetical protein
MTTDDRRRRRILLEDNGFLTLLTSKTHSDR